MNTESFFKAIAIVFCPLFLCLPGCGDEHATCGPSTCGGCCDAAGVCQPGVTSATCGAGGAACQDCAGGDCVNGSCGELPCGPDNCAGCCDTDDVCQDGTTASACGSGGQACQDCGEHGACDDSSGAAVCACDTGYAGAACDTCDAGYQDNDADGTCLPDCATSGLDCGLHGTCDDSSGAAVCACDTGYAGAACDTCDAGYQDNDADGTCLPDCATSGLDCGLHGTCDDSSGAALCTCDEGYVGDYCETCAPEYEDFGSGCVLFWVSIPGGMFMMGSDSGGSNELPVHQVTVPSFEMSRTEVTVSHYQQCVDAVMCTEPSQCDSYYNWGVAGRGDHPVNCVDWDQAVAFCTWVGGRLPSEAEWEYAARGGGQVIIYPWGDESPSCTYAVMDEGAGYGCGEDRTWAVRSKTAGNTAQGLCDMAGNVFEWVQDWYHSDYNGAPSDGSAWETPSGSYRVSRGGSFDNYGYNLRASYRDAGVPSNRFDNLGCRCARDAP